MKNLLNIFESVTYYLCKIKSLNSIVKKKALAFQQELQ